jgi:hypothetical protein
VFGGGGPKMEKERQAARKAVRQQAAFREGSGKILRRA